MRYTIFLLVFAYSCGHELKEYPPYRVEQLNELERTTLINELLDSMRNEAIEGIKFTSQFMESYTPSVTCVRWDSQTTFELYVNRKKQLLINGDPGSMEDIPVSLHRFYTFNRNLSDEQTGIKIADPEYEGYNYPFYSLISRTDVLDAIKHEKELKSHVETQGESEFAEFHQKSIEDWSEKLLSFQVIGTDELMEIHQATHIYIPNYRDSSGFSEAGEYALKGMYLVRNTAAEDYFNSSYLDLHYRSTRLNDQKARKQLQAIERLYRVAIMDEAYINSTGIYNYIHPPEEEPLRIVPTH